MKYAKSEQKNLELAGRMARMDYQTKEMAKERDAAVDKMKAARGEKQKAQNAYETRVSVCVAG